MDEISLKSHLATRVSEFRARWNSIESDIYTKHQEEDEALRQTILAMSTTTWREPIGLRSSVSVLSLCLTITALTSAVFTAVKALEALASHLNSTVSKIQRKFW